MIINAIIAIVLGYLLGSIPTAYIVARLATRKDIRKMGGGNVGGLNTFREIGFWAILPVAIVDLGKGAAAVAIAYWLLDLAQAARAVGRNFISITTPRAMARIVAVPDFVPSQVIRGRKTRAVPIDRAILWVIIRTTIIMPRKIGSPCQYP
ncbi:unnamed protein product [marine sediment metagenome]|uniref:Glycerol-3-phosphate acyltransferase n=1 Tax=marine sediment metagenome TaxID=412755 RepID=X1LUT0_9ZZZZ